MTPAGQPGLERRDLLLDPADDVDRAHPVARDHDAADRLLAALHEGGGPEGVADLHVGHLADVDRHPVLGPDHHLLEVLDALDQAEAADHDQVPLASMTLPPTFRLLRMTASTTADSGSLKARRRLGSTSIWYWRTSPPMLATSATPGTALSW